VDIYCIRSLPDAPHVLVTRHESASGVDPAAAEVVGFFASLALARDVIREAFELGVRIRPGANPGRVLEVWF